MSDASSDPDRIEQDLDRTRARLDSRLTELQDRLSPGQVLDDLMGYFRGSEGAEFGQSLLERVKDNPLPAALTGIGLAWLMATSQQSQHHDKDRVRAPGRSPGPVSTTYDALTTRVRDAERGVVRQQDEAEHTYRDRLNEARGQAVGIARQAQETAESFGQRIQDTLSAAAQTVSQGAHDLRDRVGGAASQLGSSAQNASDQLARGSKTARQMGGNLVSTLSDSPVLLGALGLAAGALLGALVPQSDEEEAALGGIAGQARDTARSLAQEAADRSSQVAQAVLDAGSKSASEHGLTGEKSAGGLVDDALSGDLAGNVKQVAQDVLRAGDEAVRKQGLGQDQDGPQAS
jgi:vacuolar-type H+-ATPase subunit H